MVSRGALKSQSFFVSNGSSFTSSFSLDGGNTFAALVTKIADPYTGPDGSISRSGDFSVNFDGTYSFNSSIPGMHWEIQSQNQVQQYNADVVDPENPATGTPMYHAEATGTGIFSVINPTSNNGIFSLSGSGGDYAITLLSLSGVASMVFQEQTQSQSQFWGYVYGANGPAAVTFGSYDAATAMGGLAVGVFAANDLDPSLGYQDWASTTNVPYSKMTGAIDTTLQALTPGGSSFLVGSHYHGYGTITEPGTLTEAFSSGDSVSGGGPASTGQVTGAMAVFIPIPEPGAFMLLGVAYVMLIGRRKCAGIDENQTY